MPIEILFRVLSVAGSMIPPVCETEVFNATCGRDEVILVTHALYGRMQLNRCATTDYGHVGCLKDVMKVMDDKCSGRRRCEVQVPEKALTDASHENSCPNDLKPYLEADYKCIMGKE